MSRKRKNPAPHRLDLRGQRFHSLPDAVRDSVSFAGLSVRARLLLYGFAARFNGYNNGSIAYSSRDMIADLDGCHYERVRDAVEELVGAGFIARMRRHARIERLADEYRLTFATYGAPNLIQQATNDYKDRVPPGGKWKHSRVEAGSTETGKSVEAVSTGRKRPVEAGSTPTQETPNVSDFVAAEAGSTLICLIPGRAASGRCVAPQMLEEDSRPEIGDLRDWATAWLHHSGQVGAQQRLAEESGVPKGTLSKFLAGGGLPDKYRTPIQSVLGRRWSFREFRQGVAA